MQFGYVVQYLQRVVEDILVSASLFHLHAFEGSQFGEDEWQQSGLVEQDPALRRTAGKHDLVQLLRDAFFGDDTDAFFVARDGVEGLAVEVET